MKYKHGALFTVPIQHQFIDIVLFENKWESKKLKYTWLNWININYLTGQKRIGRLLSTRQAQTKHNTTKKYYIFHLNEHDISYKQVHLSQWAFSKQPTNSGMNYKTKTKHKKNVPTRHVHFENTLVPNNEVKRKNILKTKYMCTMNVVVAWLPYYLDGVEYLFAPKISQNIKHPVTKKSSSQTSKQFYFHIVSLCSEQFYHWFLHYFICRCWWLRGGSVPTTRLWHTFANFWSFVYLLLFS